LRYHGGEKFQYINFISILEALNNVHELLDFESSIVPFSHYLYQSIQNQEILSMEKIMHKSMLNDWLLIEIIRQSELRSADIIGMTGNLEFRSGKCTARILPMQLINSKWIAF
jgi:hypothetical protein